MREKILNLIKSNINLTFSEIRKLVFKNYGVEGLGEFHYNESLFRNYKKGYEDSIKDLNHFLERWVFDNVYNHVEPNIIEEVCKGSDNPYVDSVKLLEAIRRFPADFS